MRILQAQRSAMDVGADFFRDRRRSSAAKDVNLRVGI